MTWSLSSFNNTIKNERRKICFVLVVHYLKWILYYEILKLQNKKDVYYLILQYETVSFHLRLLSKKLKLLVYAIRWVMQLLDKISLSCKLNVVSNHRAGIQCSIINIACIPHVFKLQRVSFPKKLFLSKKSTIKKSIFKKNYSGIY